MYRIFSLVPFTAHLVSLAAQLLPTWSDTLLTFSNSIGPAVPLNAHSVPSDPTRNHLLFTWYHSSRGPVTAHLVPPRPAWFFSVPLVTSQSHWFPTWSHPLPTWSKLILTLSQLVLLAAHLVQLSSTCFPLGPTRCLLVPPTPT